MVIVLKFHTPKKVSDKMAYANGADSNQTTPEV